MTRPIIALVSILMVSTFASAESEVPSNETIYATLANMGKFSAANDFRSWAGFFADDATFINSALEGPVVGRDAIVEFAGTWPPAETVIEWRVTENGRMAIGWRERRQLESGKMSGWYRGFSTFVFNGEGEVQEYEGMFNLLSIKAALEQVE